MALPEHPDVLFSFYERIWKRAEGEGALVFYGYRGRVDDNVNGFFDPREGEGGGGKPRIWITRKGHVDYKKPSRQRFNGTIFTDDELRAEMTTLAHEYGHFQSWKRSKDAGGEARAEWEKYNDVLHRSNEIRERVVHDTDRLRKAHQRELTAGDRDRIVKEEECAWANGRKVLKNVMEEVGYDPAYDELPAYDERTRRGVHIYRYQLGLEDEDPEATQA